MKVMLVDEDALVLAALREAVARSGIEVQLLTVPTAAAARLQLRREPETDLVLLNQFLPDGDGIEVLREFRRTWDQVPVVMVSASDLVSDVVRAVDGGAMGFVPRSSSYTELQHAMGIIMSGSMYVPRHMLAAYGEQMRAEERARGAPSQRADAAAAGAGSDTQEGDTEPAVFHPAPMHPPGCEDLDAAGEPVLPDTRPDGTPRPRTLEELVLTPRQSEVLALMLQGLPNKLIARKLNLSVETVKDHVAAVLRALGVSTRTQAVLAVAQLTKVMHVGSAPPRPPPFPPPSPPRQAMG